MDKEISTYEFKTGFSSIMSDLEKRKYDRVIITRRNKPVGELRAYGASQSVTKREFGQLQGKIRLAGLLEDASDEVSELINRTIEKDAENYK